MPVPDRTDAVAIPFVPACRSYRGVPGATLGPLAGGRSGALPLAGLTLLLVEDSRFASDALRLICQRSGARLRRAASLQQARAHLRTYCPDVLIVDLGLPDGRGEALIGQAVAEGRVQVVLGLSGDPEGRARAMAAGAKGFLDKPMDSIGGFQRAVLRHLPGRFAPTLRKEGAAVAADPLALQDDLAQAADALALAPDAAARGYLARFVAGLAKSAGDDDLARVAGEAVHRSEAVPRLLHLLRARLNEGGVM